MPHTGQIVLLSQPVFQCFRLRTGTAENRLANRDYRTDALLVADKVETKFYSSGLHHFGVSQEMKQNQHLDTQYPTSSPTQYPTECELSHPQHNTTQCNSYCMPCAVCVLYASHIPNTEEAGAAQCRAHTSTNCMHHKYNAGDGISSRYCAQLARKRSVQAIQCPSHLLSMQHTEGDQQCEDEDSGSKHTHQGREDKKRTALDPRPQAAPRVIVNRNKVGHFLLFLLRRSLAVDGVFCVQSLATTGVSTRRCCLPSLRPVVRVEQSRLAGSSVPVRRDGGKRRVRIWWIFLDRGVHGVHLCKRCHA